MSVGPAVFSASKNPFINASEDAISDCENAMEEGIAAEDLNGDAMMPTRSRMCSAGWATLALDRGNLAAARKYYKEALELRTQAGEKQTAAETRVSLAELDHRKGHASDAEASARKSQQKSLEDKQADDELNASTVLISALLAQGKQREAEKEMGKGKQLSQESQNRLLRLQFELVSGRVLLESESS